MCVYRKIEVCMREPCLVRALPVSWNIRGSGVVRRVAWDLKAPAAVFGELASPCSLNTSDDHLVCALSSWC